MSNSPIASRSFELKSAPSISPHLMRTGRWMRRDKRALIEEFGIKMENSNISLNVN
ncbi:hypothetical protein N9D46_03295 [Chitinophagales bacterium]|nr:hypothetical protein [Chitinophagales bacterium]